MKRFLTLALVGGLALGLTSVAHANFCAFDAAPASTILYPFVAFDYNNPIDGATTLYAVTNVSHEAQIVHFVLWTDYSLPIFDWNVILSGYDVQTQNIRDLLYFGDLPNTGTAPALVVNGPIPLADGPVTQVSLPDSQGTNAISSRCPTSSQWYPDYPIMPQSLLDSIRLFLQASQEVTRGHAVCNGDYTRYQQADWFEGRTANDVTWMYITADVVWECNNDLIDNPQTQYFNVNTNANTATNQARYNPRPEANVSASGQKMVENVLMGDVFWVNNAARFSEADNAVHIEADWYNDNVVTITPDGFPSSFYYRYSSYYFDIFSIENDRREPLPTAWAFRYIGWQDNSADTWIRAFKQAHRPQQATSIGARTQWPVWDLYVGSPSSGYPTSLLACDLLAYTYFAFDEDENVRSTGAGNPWSCPPNFPTCGPSFSPNLLPLETQEVSVDQFNMVDTDGWVLFLWPASNWAVSPSDAWTRSDWYQTWMGAKYGAYGTYSAAISATVMGNFNCFSDQTLYGGGTLGVGYDYIEQTFPGTYRESPAIGGGTY